MDKGCSTYCLPCAELLLWTSSLSDFCVACSLSGYCSEATDESVLRGFCFRSAERVLKLALCVEMLARRMDRVKNAIVDGCGWMFLDQEGC